MYTQAEYRKRGVELITFRYARMPIRRHRHSTIFSVADGAVDCAFAGKCSKLWAAKWSRSFGPTQQTTTKKVRIASRAIIECCFRAYGGCDEFRRIQSTHRIWRWWHSMSAITNFWSLHSGRYYSAIIGPPSKWTASARRQNVRFTYNNHKNNITRIEHIHSASVHNNNNNSPFSVFLLHLNSFHLIGLAVLATQMRCERAHYSARMWLDNRFIMGTGKIFCIRNFAMEMKLFPVGNGRRCACVCVAIIGLN